MIDTARWVAGVSRATLVAWTQAKRHWYAGALTSACALFTLSHGTNQKEASEFQGLLQEVAHLGGGLLVVSFALECRQTMTAIDDIARRVQAADISVRGLVITDGLAPSTLSTVLEAAASSFPHIPQQTVRWRTVRAVAEVAGTPALIGVNSMGRILFVDHLSQLLEGDAEAEAHRLVTRLGGSG